MIKLKSIGLCLCYALGLAAQGADSEHQAAALAAPSPAERIADLAGQVRRAQWLDAIEAGQALLAGPAQLAERQRGEVHFATALARAMHAAESAGSQVPALAPTPPAAGHAALQAPSPKPPLGAGYLAAAADFESSRALAGPGELRLSATYDLGTSALMRAELWRLEIPEIAQAGGQQVPAAPQAMAPLPGAPGSAGSPEEAAPDPLEEARSAFLQAKAHLILRLRSDWRDSDTRANLEWIQRRLRELQEIEEQRKQEEQEKEQDPDQQQDEQDGEDGQEGEPGDEGEDQQQDPKDPGEEGDESPEDQEGGEDPESEEESPEEGDPEQDGQEQRPDSEAEGGEAQSSGEQPAERVMTREEMIRLMDKLADLEAEAQTLKDAQAKSQTVRVDRDW